LRANHHALRSLFRSDFTHGLHHRIIINIRERRLIHIRRVDRRFRCQQKKVTSYSALVVSQRNCSRRTSRLQRRLNLFEHVQFLSRNFVAALEILLRFFASTLDCRKIRQSKLDLNRLDVPQWIDFAFDVHDVLIFKATNDLDHCVRFSNVGEKLVAQTFTLRSPAHETSDVEKLNRRRHDLLGFNESCEWFQTFVRH
jgi:hypothetical protein